MANKILKGLAMAAGTGVAIGLGAARRRRVVPTIPNSVDVLSLEPLVERLDRLESRILAVEAHPLPDAGSASIAELDLLTQNQSRDIESLRAQLAETGQKVAGQMAGIEGRVAEVARDLPAMIESFVQPRVDELRAEMRASMDTTIASFEKTIDDKVSERMARIESTLVEQSGAITALSQKAIDSDLNLQRLISAVEKLCERTEPAFPQPAAKERSLMDLPFEKHLSEAITRQTQPIQAPLPPDSGFRPRIIPEEPERMPHRAPLTRI
jgi:uncharacterized coiled-coil protein SlyX